MLTVADVMSHLAVVLGQSLSGITEQKVRSAVLDAWGRMFHLKEWKWHHRVGRVQLETAQTDGTIEFTESTRQVTITDSTWPTDAEFMHIRINNIWYPVQKRVSSTVLELETGNHPPADVAAGTAYYLQKVLYPLPAECSNVVQLVDPDATFRMQELQLVETLDLSEAFGHFTLPTHYSLMHSSRYPHRWCLWIPTIITTDKILTYLYTIQRPERVIYRIADGTVTLSSGVATFSKTICRTHWVGSVLRISNTNEMPTGPRGDMVAGNLRFNNDMIETQVLEYLTTSTVRVADTSSSVSNQSLFTLSSHIDVRQGAGETLMMRLAEDQYGTRPVANHAEGLTSRRKVQEAYMEASAQDAVGFRTDFALLPNWYSLRLDDIATVSS